MNPNTHKLATKILDGWRLSNQLRDKISYSVDAVYKRYRVRPGLAVIHVGNALEMERYVYAKKQLGHALGVNFYEYQYPESIETRSLQESIQDLNRREDIHGIIVQLPLPKHLDSQAILDTILPEKDVDGCGTFNQEKLGKDSMVNIPCAAMAMVHYLQISCGSFAYSIPTKRKRAVIVGSSALVGYPCYCLLQRMGCICTMVDKHTPAIPSITSTADIIVSAVGQPFMIQGDWIKEGATLIDIGTRCIQDETGAFVLAGDVDMSSCIGRAGAITPVPGGVALLTTAMLMKNTVQSLIRQYNLADCWSNLSDASLFQFF